MSTETTEMDNSAQNSLHVSTENVTYRTYGSYGEDGKIKSAKVRRQSSDGKVWEALERAGETNLAENTFVWYTLLDEEGFVALVPSPEQRLAILNKGLNAIQTAEANQTQAETNEDNTEYVTNGQTIDLHEAINEPINKRGLTTMQKLANQLSGCSIMEQLQLIAQLQRDIAKASGTVTE